MECYLFQTCKNPISLFASPLRNDVILQLANAGDYINIYSQGFHGLNFITQITGSSSSPCTRSAFLPRSKAFHLILWVYTHHPLNPRNGSLCVSTDGGTQDVLWNRQLTNQLSPFFYLFFFFFFPWSLRFLSAQVCVVCAGRYEWWDLAVLSSVIAKREKEVRWTFKKKLCVFFSLLFRFFFLMVAWDLHQLHDTAFLQSCYYVLGTVLTCYPVCGHFVASKMSLFFQYCMTVVSWWAHLLRFRL